MAMSTHGAGVMLGNTITPSLTKAQNEAVGQWLVGLLKAGATINATDPSKAFQPLPDGSISCGLEIKLPPRT